MGFGETSVLWVSKPSLAGRHATNKIRRPATARRDFAPRQIREIMIAGHLKRLHCIDLVSVIWNETLLGRDGRHPAK